MKGFFRGALVAMVKNTAAAGIFFTGLENITFLTKKY
jgi:hypothetical protein